MAERAQSIDTDRHVDEFPVGNVKLRILLVIETCGGGSGRHLVDLAGGLLRRGHHVCLIYSPARADEWFVRAISNLEGLLVHSIDMRRNPGWRDVNSARLIRRAIARLGPFDIVHGHSSKAGALLRLAHGRDQSACVYTPQDVILPLRKVFFDPRPRNCNSMCTETGSDTTSSRRIIYLCVKQLTMCC